MSAGELTRIVKLDRLPVAPLEIEASEAERAALAKRFGLPAIHSLTAAVTLVKRGEAVDATGRLAASFEQRCALTDEPFAASLDEAVAIRFVPELVVPGEEEEIEFASDTPDEIEFDGAAIDLGEAVAQSFGLALDPYATGPGAEEARRMLEESGESGPFAALAALKGEKKER